MRFALWLLAFSALALPNYVAAQNLDLDREIPPLDADGFLGIQGTTTPGPAHFNFVMALGWQYRPLMLTTESGEEIEGIRDRMTTTFAAQVGIGGRLAIGVAAPFVTWQSGNGQLINDRPLPNVAAGDPRISLRYRLIGESASIPRERNEGPGLALQLTSTVPVGQTDAFTGEGATRISAQLLGDFHVLNAAIGAMIGYRHRFERRTFLGQEYGDEIEFGAALQLPLLVMRDFVGIIEFRSVTDTRAFFARETSSAELAIGARMRLGDVFLTSSIGVGFLPGVGDPLLRSTFDISWAPRVHDLDQDGLPDDRDVCPPLAEDLDGFQDRDGCPDPDNDNDLIPDPDDRCPMETAEEGRDDDEDGCTDPQDVSVDHNIPDVPDAVPNNPENDVASTTPAAAPTPAPELAPAPQSPEAPSPAPNP